MKLGGLPLPILTILYADYSPRHHHRQGYHHQIVVYEALPWSCKLFGAGYRRRQPSSHQKDVGNDYALLGCVAHA